METLLIIKIGIAIIFGYAVITKLSGRLKSEYEDWNLGVNFMYALAVVETICIVGLFTPYAHLASYVLLGVMIGALFTLISKREPLKRCVTALLASGLLIAYVIMTHG